MPCHPSMFQVFRSWRQWEEMGAGKTHHTYIFACLSLTHHPCSLRAWNRLHSSKIHKTLIMQKCPNLQQELKYQEFLYPVGKKANTSLRVSLFLNSFKMPTTLHLYAWTHICAPPFSMLFPHGKKKPFCNPWGHCCESNVFILSYHLKRSGTVFNNQYELIIV